jgi:GntR family transcriptional regulator/MocR family aminotransferase
LERAPTFELDETVGKPIFLKLASAILREIERGRLKPGDALPGTRALAKTLGIHRNTVDAAYQELTLQGWLVARPSRGTFVADDLPDMDESHRLPRRITPTPNASQTETRTILAFTDGAPDPRLVPRTELARAFRRALSAPAFLSPTGQGFPIGEPVLRVALAEYLNRERGLVVTPADLLVTRGSQMALFLAAHAVLDPGDTVVVEDPGYPPAWAAFRAAGARVVGVPVDEQGLSVDHLASLAEREPKLRAVYVTPHHQYPTTVTLGAGRRLKLLDMAGRHGLTIIEDDYDHEYRFDGRPVLPLAARAEPNLDVVYVGSLSKLLAPGIRLGYAIAAPDRLRRMAEIRHFVDRQGDLPLEHAVATLIADGELRRHVHKARRIYQVRRTLLVEAIRRELGNSVNFDLPAGGLALWLRVNAESDAEQWAERAQEHGLAVTPGSAFVLMFPSSRNAFRLGYASLDGDELHRAVADLARSRPDR